MLLTGVVSDLWDEPLLYPLCRRFQKGAGGAHYSPTILSFSRDVDFILFQVCHHVGINSTTIEWAPKKGRWQRQALKGLPCWGIKWKRPLSRASGWLLPRFQICIQCTRPGTLCGIAKEGRNQISVCPPGPRWVTYGQADSGIFCSRERRSEPEDVLKKTDTERSRSYTNWGGKGKRSVDRVLLNEQSKSIWNIFSIWLSKKLWKDPKEIKNSSYLGRKWVGGGGEWVTSRGHLSLFTCIYI